MIGGSPSRISPMLVLGSQSIRAIGPFVLFVIQGKPRSRGDSASLPQALRPTRSIRDIRPFVPFVIQEKPRSRGRGDSASLPLALRPTRSIRDIRPIRVIRDSGEAAVEEGFGKLATGSSPNKEHS